ncbi:MAG TPA: sigma-54 dependent transcriptional regulator [Spirochaetia bacterium]|nr:sigma-54 dependent transcriptional regulator [Spirochaetia bacterium]
MKLTILVADDEKNIREGLREALALDGYEVLTAADGQEALEAVTRGDVDLLITDLKMPRLSGEELLKSVTAQSPTLPVIILTGHGTIESAVQAMHDGAYDFLTKPVNLDRLSLLVKRALASRELAEQNRVMQEELERRSGFASIIGRSNEMRQVFEIVRQVAPSRSSVLITGESGSGKEMIAEALHYNSPRKDKPFIKVHCAALTESLLESELFGHEKGAFTGAIARKRGRFELAHLGTLFLDEIGEINQNVQIKLLRVLEEKRFERVGGEETVEVDVRLIAATNRDLKEAISKGTFREDLYYRLNVVNIHIPPLRERKEDIPLLASAFLREFAQENAKPLEGIDAKARLAMYNYPWPGNVRQLRNSIESAVVLAKGTLITLDDLPPNLRGETGGDLLRLPVGASLADVEKEVIRSTLAREGGNKSRTAEILGIGRKTLHRKIEEYGL